MSATDRGAVRHANDFYATPRKALDPLLERIRWAEVSSFLEPCKGDGAIYSPVQPFVPDCDWREIRDGLDYFDAPCPRRDLIITNPPFSQAQEFLEKSLGEAQTVCYLLRINFLGSAKRREFWQRNPPSHLIALAERPSFTGNGKTDATDYGWFCWDRGEVLKIQPGIYVV